MSTGLSLTEHVLTNLHSLSFISVRPELSMLTWL